MPKSIGKLIQGIRKRSANNAFLEQNKRLDIVVHEISVSGSVINKPVSPDTSKTFKNFFLLIY